MNGRSWLSVIGRCLQVTKCADVAELAVLFETAVEEIDAVLSGKEPCPRKWLLICIVDYKANPTWLLSGKGKMTWEPGDRLDELLGLIDGAP